MCNDVKHKFKVYVQTQSTQSKWAYHLATFDYQLNNPKDLPKTVDEVK
jgi:hypothetical protein